MDILIGIIGLGVLIVVQAIAIGLWAGRQGQRNSQVYKALYDKDDNSKIEALHRQLASIDGELHNGLKDQLRETCRTVEELKKCPERIEELHSNLDKMGRSVNRLDRKFGRLQRAIDGCPVRRTDRRVCVTDEGCGEDDCGDEEDIDG